MPDILIRMEMPGSCYECVIKHKFFSNLHCAELDGMKGFDSLALPHEYDRHPDCPLVELPPHGDLIDRDKILFDAAEVCEGCGDYAVFGYSHEQIENAPVVVQAEREGET